MIKTLHFKTNINCNNCLQNVAPHLDSLAGVFKWDVNIDDSKKILTVTGENISSAIIKKAVKNSGYKIESAHSIFSSFKSFLFKNHDENCCQ